MGKLWVSNRFWTGKPGFGRKPDFQVSSAADVYMIQQKLCSVMLDHDGTRRNLREPKFLNFRRRIIPENQLAVALYGTSSTEKKRLHGTDMAILVYRLI